MEARTLYVSVSILVHWQCNILTPQAELKNCHVSHFFYIHIYIYIF